jgi:hypothetical protein
MIFWISSSLLTDSILDFPSTLFKGHPEQRDPIINRSAGLIESLY